MYLQLFSNKLKFTENGGWHDMYDPNQTVSKDGIMIQSYHGGLCVKSRILTGSDPYQYGSRCQGYSRNLANERPPAQRHS